MFDRFKEFANHVLIKRIELEPESDHATRLSREIEEQAQAHRNYSAMVNKDNGSAAFELAREAYRNLERLTYFGTPRRRYFRIVGSWRLELPSEQLQFITRG